MTDPSWELVDSTMIVCKLQVLTSVDKVRVIQAVHVKIFLYKELTFT